MENIGGEVLRLHLKTDLAAHFCHPLPSALQNELARWSQPILGIDDSVSRALDGIRAEMEKALQPIVGIQASMQRMLDGPLPGRQCWLSLTDSSVHEQLEQSTQPMLAIRDHFQSALARSFAEQDRWRDMISSIQIPRFEFPSVALLAERLLPRLDNLFSDQIRKAFEDLPPRYRAAVLRLAAHSWYPDLWQLEHELSEGNVKEAEDALALHFECRLAAIEEGLVHKFPHRTMVLRQAFKAHRNEEYALSIPVLLAQTDGICKELAKEYYFLKCKKRPRTALYVEQKASDTWEEAVLSPLAHTLPIGASENERPEGFTELNRHMVLHGDSGRCARIS